MQRTHYAWALLALAFVACDEVDDPIDDNNDPVAVISADDTGERGVGIELDGSGSHDPDGDDITFAWSFAQRPAGSAATITDASDEIASFVPDAIGTYIVQLTVSDGDADVEDEHTITIDVQALGSITTDSIIENTSSPAGEADYRVDDFDVLGISADVVIEPGVTIRMGEGSSIDVQTGGSLSAVGTEALPIRLIGANDVPGHWNNVEIESNNSANELTWVEIRNAGGNSFGAVYLTGRATITNSTISESADYGIDATSTGELPGFANNTFSDNALGSLYISPQLIGSLDAASDYLGSGDGVVTVYNGNVTGTHTWQALNAPVRFADFAFPSIEGNLTIQPGALFVMGEGASIQVATGGSLSAVGTAIDMIHFVGANEVQGHWNNFEFDSNNSANRLSYVEIAHAGGNNFGAVYVGGTVRIDNSIIRDSGDFGIEALTSALLPDFSSNHFLANALGPITLPADLMGSLDSESVYGDANGVNYINVSGAQTGTNQTWRKTDIPFFLQTSDFVTINSAITVEPGFQMHMGEASSIAVETGGSILAYGTAEDTIRFVGAQPTAGYWSNFEINSNASNTMSFVEIGHGGGNSFGMVYVTGTLTLANSRLHHSGDVAVEVTPSGTFTGTGNTYEDNALAPQQ